jgi:phosphoribosyl 1,2-cyclic phosphodiesterase
MTRRTYKLRFWGVRGTVPTPESEKLRYGGHTSCLAIDLGDREHLILDCGTGIRLLGKQQAERPGPHRYHIFFSHYHLDHLIGLPFFHPLYDRDSTIVFHGFATESRSVKEILQGVMSPPYFPVELKNVPAKVQYVPDDRSPVQIGDLIVNSLALNHPDGCLSYRLDNGDRRIVYATDHEHGDARTDQELIRFSTGADYLIYDAMYQETEYERLRRGWGHSTWYAAIQAALAAKVKHLVLFHHHPEHTDEELERILALAREELPTTEIATEGMELPL